MGNGGWAGGLGRHRRRVSGVTGPMEHQKVLGKGDEEVQARESEQHPGEPAKNPPGETE